MNPFIEVLIVFGWILLIFFGACFVIGGLAGFLLGIGNALGFDQPPK